MGKRIRILLVDNHEVVRCGVRSILEQEEDMEIVGDCSSTEEALLQADTLSPNIILMDAKTPSIGGIEATRHLWQEETPCRIIILTLYQDCVADAMRAGVSGYLLQDIKSTELVQAIRKVNHGELVIDERLTSTPQATEWRAEYLLPEGNSSDLLIREAQLIIPRAVDAAQLLRFLYQVEETLEATIVQDVGSWNKDTAITILLRNATPLAVILDKLGKMPEVEEVREKLTAEDKPFSFVKKITARSKTYPWKELLVRLKQIDTTKQAELASSTP